MFKHHFSCSRGCILYNIGAAGAVETAFAALSLRDGIVPPTLNLHNIDPSLHKDTDPFQHVPLTKKIYGESPTEHGGSSNPGELKYVLKNSFGFGGTNASLVLGKYFTEDRV